MIVKTKITQFQVIVTERAGHAFDVMASTANKDLKMYDGIVAVVSKTSLHFFTSYLQDGEIRSSHIIVEHLVGTLICIVGFQPFISPN